MNLYLQALSGLAVVTIIYLLLSTFLENRHHARRAMEMGCLPPHQRHQKYPFGLDLLMPIVKADQERVLPDYFMDLYLHELGQRNTWQQDILGLNSVWTVDPKNIQTILATKFQDYDLGSLRRKNFFPVLGNGIFTVDGKAWEHSRSLLRPQFARQQVADLDLEEVHVTHLLKHLTTQHGWTNQVNLVPLFFRLTLDSATEFLFGQSVNSQSVTLTGSSKESAARATELDWTNFAACFDGATSALGVRGLLGPFYWMWSPPSFRRNCKEIHRFADYYVNLALKDSSPLTRSGQEKNEQKRRYVFLEELVEATQDPVEVRSQLLNILVAGRDTTAGLLSWTFWLLVRHPDIFKKLRQSIIDDFGTFQNPRAITFETLKSCGYLQYTLSESLRLFPTVPFNTRRAVRDTILPLGGGPDGKSPVYIKKGTEVNYLVHIMHHREDIWGSDVEEFNPDRWRSRKGGWEFLPFNGGPRICLGQQFALTEASYVIVRLMQKFDKIEVFEPDPVTRHMVGVTSAPARLYVRLHEAEV
ncbi:hypothetical protein LTR84_008571 [Exophiala bonariae]|uniref:Cytochrome P450 n=1 Tax=Exophiala bonariae TaxID=1690606 RepID=A0AAV9MWP0_9EURO|nr:hypothetical protein LTR84_008571 [Exophiala bonariae]